MKKKILFVVIHAGIGGIEKAFYNLVNELVKMEDYEIDIYMFTQKGELLEDYPPKCRILPQDNTLRLIGITQNEAWKEGIGIGIRRLILGGIAKYISKDICYKIAMRKVKELQEYDVAVSYMNGVTKSFYGGTNEFVLNKVNAKRYFTIIHADLILANLNVKYNRKMYQKFDKVASVSDSCKNLLIDTWPEFKEKACTVENCCNVEEILIQAEESVDYIRRKINFVTVARLGAEKGFIRAIEVFAKIKERYTDFTWHIVGTGLEEENIKNKIRECELEDVIILHGVKKNPYPYIKLSDAFLLVSYREAAPMVFQEAHVLRTPILTTETRSARELVEKQGIGIVCENSSQGLYSMLINIFENPQILTEFRKTMTIKDNKKALKQFISMIEEE